MTAKSPRVPAALQDKFNAITQASDAFCDLRLNDEYKQLIREATAALSRKRPSPLLKGKDNAWAAGLVHALGMVNFLFDASQTPHCKASDIQTHFGVGASTCSSRSKEVREALGMNQMSPEWMLASRLDKSPLVWMLEVNGLMVDVRQMPLEVQEIAYQKGFIPYIPGLKDSDKGGPDAGTADRAPPSPPVPHHPEPESPRMSQKKTSKKTLRATLEQGLLHGAAMSAALCEEVLMETIDEFEESLREDGDDALIAFVAEDGEMAMLLIDKAGTIHRNEAAREQLKLMWRSYYAANLDRLLPIFVDDLSQGMLAVGGVQWVAEPPAA
jgi:hypothetical protein